MMRRCCFLVVLSVGLLISGVGHAKTDRDLTYRYGQIWSTLVRFLRVDNGYKILEKDKDDGYILFEYTDTGRTCQSSFQLVATIVEGRQYVRSQLHIADMPTYVEIVLQDRLRRKLREEYGTPPPARTVKLDGDKGDDDDSASKNEADSESENANNDDKQPKESLQED